MRASLLPATEASGPGPNRSMGLMTYGIPIELPAGYEGITPQLRLEYGSGAQNSPLGLGWSIDLPSIERMTSHGLPRYRADDVFAANGATELTRIGTTQTFRARSEGGFVRYTWVDAAGSGTGGYWKAEYPDGSIGYFGARSTGAIDNA